MGAENADLRWFPRWNHMPEYGRSRAVVQAMNEARQKPKRISVEDLVPENVRQYYGDLWQSEQENLVAEEARRLAEEARWASLWWWQKVRETLWPKR